MQFDPFYTYLQKRAQLQCPTPIEVNLLSCKTLRNFNVQTAGGACFLVSVSIPCRFAAACASETLPTHFISQVFSTFYLVVQAFLSLWHGADWRL